MGVCWAIGQWLQVGAWSEMWSSLCVSPPEGRPTLTEEQKELPGLLKVVV